MRIICKNISKAYGPLEVLSGVDVATEGHDFVCILGPNGCGKTTLLKIMAGILAPSGGEILYEDGRPQERKVSYVYQEYGLFPWFNVMDNICFHLEMKGLSREERYGRARNYVEEMGLAPFRSYYPHQLSVGMKQKVGLIRGLLMDSPVLLIDEADASLDIHAKSVAQKDIYRIWRDYNKTVVYVTHDVDGALQLARHIWIMSQRPGTIIKKIDLSAGPNDKSVIKQEIVDIFQSESVKV